MIADPSHEEHEEMAEWLAGARGEDFDPAAFDIAKVNARLTSVTIPRST